MPRVCNEPRAVSLSGLPKARIPFISSPLIIAPPFIDMPPVYTIFVMPFSTRISDSAIMGKLVSSAVQPSGRSIETTSPFRSIFILPIMAFSLFWSSVPSFAMIATGPNPVDRNPLTTPLSDIPVSLSPSVVELITAPPFVVICIDTPFIVASILSICETSSLSCMRNVSLPTVNCAWPFSPTSVKLSPFASFIESE